MSAAVQVTHHEVRYERNTVTGLWRGKCSTCHWMMTGEQKEVQSRAATHDLEWVPVEPVKVCKARIPDTQNLCTRELGHSGDHRCLALDVDARKRKP